MDADLIEQLAEQVHISWMTEKQAQGFADHVWAAVSARPDWCAAKPHAVTPCLLPRERHHADMLPYADLAENVKEYDRATVRAVLHALSAAVLEVVSAPSTIRPDKAKRPTVSDLGRASLRSEIQ